MKTRLFALVLVVSGFVAQAQDTLTPPPPPPLVSAPEAPLVTVPPVGMCSENRDCARGYTCVGMRDLGNGQWSKGTCQSLGGTGACSSTRDCSGGFICAGYQDLGDGKWSQGTCMSRDLRPPAAPGEPSGLPFLRSEGRERFQYTGTVPTGFHLVSQPRMKLVIGGVAALAGGHLLSVLAALIANQPLAAIPLAGPVILAVQLHDTTGTISLLAVLDVACQAVGVALLTIGLASPEQWLERDASKPHVSLLPGAAGTPLGASLVGRF
jgi:hypothetical protein